MALHRTVCNAPSSAPRVFAHSGTEGAGIFVERPIPCWFKHLFFLGSGVVWHPLLRLTDGREVQVGRSVVIGAEAVVFPGAARDGSSHVAEKLLSQTSFHPAPFRRLLGLLQWVGLVPFQL